MTTVTIPKSLIREKNLFVVPQDTYEEFLVWQKMIKSRKTFTISVAEKGDWRECEKILKSVY